MFENPDFEVDRDAPEYRLLNPVLSRLDKSKETKKAEPSLMAVSYRMITAYYNFHSFMLVLIYIDNNYDRSKTKKRRIRTLSCMNRAKKVQTMRNHG